MTDTIWPPDFSISTEPKYIVLIQSMRAAIRSGVLEPGFKMPPVRELAWQLGITPGTVARAYKLAADEGLVDSAVGKGTFVTGGLVTEPVLAPPITAMPPSDGLDFRSVRVPETGQAKILQDIMARQCTEGGHELTDYLSAEAEYAAQAAICEWVGSDRVGRCDPGDVVLGLGAQHSVILALQSILHGPHPVIFTEELAYPGVRHAARLLRADIVGLEMDAHGIRPDRFEEALRRHGGQVLLTSAEVHSPTTINTTLERRQEIVRIARKYQVQIVEDDCHCLTRPDTPSYRAMCPERGWYVSSITKSVSAVVRFGYVLCPSEQAMTALQVARSTFYCMPQPTLDLCTELLRGGAAEQIRKATLEVVGAQVRSAVNILGQWDIKWRPDAPFLWLKLPQGWRGSSFDRACMDEGIRIKPADEFSLPDGQAPNAVRIALNASVPQDASDAALRKMAKMLRCPPGNVEF